MATRRLKLDRPGPHRLLWLAISAVVLSWLIYQYAAAASPSPPAPPILSSIPTPGTLGLLAMGMLLIVPWRRLRPTRWH